MPKEKTWVTGVKTMPNGNEKLLYTITANLDRTKYYLNDATGKRLHTADNPLKFDKDIWRLFYGT